MGRIIGSAESSSFLTLNSTYAEKIATAQPLSKYAVGGVAATLNLDFKEGQYRLGKTGSTFADAFTGNSPKLTYSTAAGSNSTMVNSAGNIVWAPHNLHSHSIDLSSWSVSTAGTSAAPSSGNELGDIPTTLLTATAGSAQHRTYDVQLTNTGHPVTFSFYIKPGTFDYVQFHDGVTVTYWADFDLTGNGSVIRHTGFDATPTIEAVTSAGQTFFKVTVQYTAASAASGVLPIISFPDPSTVVSSGTRNPTWTAAGTETLYIGGVHIYRSDLGGMAQVPGAATGFEYYVPTSSSAEYLPRVGHHVYNGSAWVNEGLLIESEARTNLVLDSNSDNPNSYGSARLDYTGQTLRTTGPDGVADSMLKLQESTSTGNHWFATAITVPVGTNTFSCIVKDAGDGRWVYWRTNNDGVNQWINVNPATGEVTEVGTAVNDYGVIDLGNGFYRLWFSCDSADGSSGWILASSNSATPGNSTPSFAGTLEAGFYFGFFQVEAGSTPSSYMPTNGGTYTRTAQSLEVPAHWYDVDNPTYTGPELVTDFSTYASDADFFADGYVRSDAVKATFDPVNDTLDITDATNVRIDGHVSFVEGVTYQVSFTNDGPNFVSFQDNFNDFNQSFSTGTSTFVFTKGSGANVRVVVGAGATASISNLSIRQVSAPQFGWPEPEYISPELVTNGTFDTDTSGWTAAQGTISVVSGIKRLTNSGAAYGYSYQAFTTTVGAIYEVSGDIKMGTASGAYLRVGTTPTGVDLYNSGIVSADETKTALFVATSTTTYVHVINNNDADAYTDFDNISVREIHPLSVSIQMDGRMTYADNNSTTELEPWRWYEDINNYIQMAIRTDSTFSGGPNFGQKKDTSTFISNASLDPYSPGVNVPFNISSRHGSTFINGAADGVALAANTTPTALPDLSGTNLQIAYNFMGTIGQFRQFAGDIGDAGLETSSDPGPSLSLTFDGSATSSFVIN